MEAEHLAAQTVQQILHGVKLIHGYAKLGFIARGVHVWMMSTARQSRVDTEMYLFLENNQS